MKTALLVIDVQRALCEGAENAFESQPVIGRINRVTEKARAAGVVVIFIQHETATGLLAYGTPGWQLAPGLQTMPGELILRKTATDSFHRTELEPMLRQRGITDLVICGMHTEYCVDTTTRRALALGYPVTLVADGHTTQDKAHLSAAQIIRHHNATLSTIVSFGPRVRLVSADGLRLDG